MTEPIVCGRRPPNGPCTRKVLPGAGGCGFHPAPPAPESERHPQAAPTCGCESPAALPARDGGPTRCLWCSRPLPGQRPTIERNGTDELVTTSPESRRGAPPVPGLRRQGRSAEAERPSTSPGASFTDQERTDMGTDDVTSFNDLIRAKSERQVEKERRDHERFFGPQPEPDGPPNKPQGSADGGEGEAEDHETEYVQTEAKVERMRVFTDAELYGNPNEKENQ